MLRSLTHIAWHPFCGTSANSAKPDQMPHFVTSDLVLHCLPMSDAASDQVLHCLQTEVSFKI